MLLKTQWHLFCRELTGHYPFSRQLSESWWQRIRTDYSEEPRAYHNLDHILDCFIEWNHRGNKFGLTPLQRVQIEAALWFHDVIYNPKGSRNEELSAEMAIEFLNNFPLATDAMKQRVSGLILLTKHNQTPEDPEGMLVVDIDLSVLGKPWTQFVNYEQAIRKEYEWVDEKQFCEARIGILKKFLTRPRIYLTPDFHERYEKRAQDNLKKSIRLLSDRLGTL